MPFDTPMAFGGWLAEATGYASLHFAVITNFRLMFARYTAIMRTVIPADELPHVRRNAWIFFLVYAATGGLIVLGVNELL
jgi:hypothetical protein